VGERRLAAEPFGLREEHRRAMTRTTSFLRCGNRCRYDGNMYSVPFYGESSFLMYRKDCSRRPASRSTRIRTTAAVAGGRGLGKTIKEKVVSDAGICLRGKPGWGEVLAPLDTVINTFGGRWFDDQWNAQLNSPEVSKAVNFYVNLINEAARSVPPRRDSRSAPTCSARVRPRCGTTRRRPCQCSRTRRSTRNYRARSATCPAPDRREAEFGLAVHVVARHPEARQESRRRMEVHLLDDQQGLHESGRREAGLGARPTGQ
jgi:hypothetical protein